MMRSSKEKVQVDYAPPQKDPSDGNRSATDRVFAYTGVFVFIVWLLLCCHSLYNAHIKRTPEDMKKEDFVKENLFEAAIFFSPSVILTGAIILAFLYLIYWIPKICILAMMVCSIVSIVFMGIEWERTLPIIPVYCFFLIQNVAIVLSLRLVKLSNVTEFIKKSFKAMFNFPSLIPFSLCMVFLQIFVVILISFSTSQLDPDKISKNWRVTEAITELGEILQNCGLTKSIIVLGGVYLCVFIFFFELMVVSHTLASWHYTEDKNNSSSIGILKSISIVTRYHMGSVAFISTGILPLGLAIYTAVTHKSQRKTESRSYLAEILWYLTLIVFMPEYASILISAYGMDSSQSMQKVWTILTRKCTFSFALVNIVGLLIGFGSTIVFLPSHRLVTLFAAHVVFVPHIIVLIIFSSWSKVTAAIQVTQLFSLEKDFESENGEEPIDDTTM